MNFSSTPRRRIDSEKEVIHNENKPAGAELRDNIAGNALQLRIRQGIDVIQGISQDDQIERGIFVTLIENVKLHETEVVETYGKALRLPEGFSRDVGADHPIGEGRELTGECTETTTYVEHLPVSTVR